MAPPRPANDCRWGCFHTFGPYVLPELLAHMADVAPVTEVRAVEGDQRSLAAGLMSGEIELALLYDMGLGDDFERERLTALKPYVLLPDGHPLAARGQLEPDDLLDEPFILLESPPSRDYFLSIFENCERPPRMGHSSSSFEMVRGLVAHGLGYALLATKPASAMSYDGKALVTRPLVSDVEASHVVLARRAGKPLSDAARTFTDHCRQHFSENIEAQHTESRDHGA